MKQIILKASGILVVLASLEGISTALFATDGESVTRYTAVGAILGLASIGLFFVGLVFPKNS